MTKEQIVEILSNTLTTDMPKIECIDCELGIHNIEDAADAILAELEQNDDLLARIASAAAHRVCCGTEHDPLNGKLHGYCVVCGVPWPCDTAEKYL